jgi:hypothetical protein
MNLKNLALAAFVGLMIVFALLAVVESDRATSTTTITSFSTVYSATLLLPQTSVTTNTSITTSTTVITLNGSTTTITSFITLNGSEQFALCDATTYSAAGTVTSGQTSSPTTTLGSMTYVKITNVTETSGYVTTSTQSLGPLTAPPYEVVTCTYIS